MRIAFAGGGSGGHVYPLVAVARRALERGCSPGDLLFLVTREGLEHQIVTTAGFSSETVHAAKLIWRNMLRAPVQMAMGLFDARRALARFAPDVVLATGGYVAVPSVLAAASLSVRRVLVEPNTVPGRANMALARLADGVLTSFEETARHLPWRASALLVGTPLRFRFDPAKVKRGPGRTLLVMGGSQGARALNLAVRRLYPRLAAIEGLEVVHVTGTRDHAAVTEGLPAGFDKIEIVPYTERMDELYYRADFALCRAGAVTLWELVEFGVPAIFVPHEPSVGDHQFKNARVLAALGAADVVRASQLDDESLYARIRSFAQNGQLDRRRQALVSLRREGTTDRVLDLLERLVTTGRLADD
jgi:UDP-N-acetylglucosamine--N-acetylmuramyl-(pentapeptide) pyrophosphoryl-undecaprenol N-acetylglucosamine transferase